MKTIPEVLAEARRTGDVSLAPCALLTDVFDLGPPYKVGILHLLLQRRLLLNDPVGTGKTACALGAYAYYRQKALGRLVVLANDSALFQWQAEVYGYKGKQMLEPDARRARYLASPADVWILTYGLAARDIPTLLQHPFILVCDEIQFMRGSGQRRKVVEIVGGRKHTTWKAALLHPAARALSTRAIGAWGLSATPFMKQIEDVHGVYDVLVPGLLGTRPQFQKRYIRTMNLTRKDGRTFPKVIGYMNEAELTARLAPYTLARDEGQLAAYLPKVLPLRRVDVELGPAQRALYDRILTEFPGGTPTAGEKLAALVHAQMATDAPAALGYPKVPSAKWEALKDFLTDETAGKQAVVYTFFASVARWLHEQCTAAGITAGLITGDQSTVKRFDVQQAFQKGEIRVVIVTSAGIYGVNLRAPVFVFYGLPWVWGDSIQAVGRTRRRVTNGHPGSLMVLALLATNTMNEHALAALRQSQEANERLYGPIRNSSKHSALRTIPESTMMSSSTISTTRDQDPTLSTQRSLDLDFDLKSEGDESDGLKGLSDSSSLHALFASVKRGVAPETGPLPEFFADAS